MKVLLVTPDFPPARGGIQAVSAGLARWLDTETRVVTLGGAALDDGDMGVHRVRAVPIPKGRVLSLNAAAVAEARAYAPDVVLSLHVVAAPAAWAVSRSTGARWAQYVYALEMAHRPRLTRFAVRGADAVIAVSSYSRDLAVALQAPEAKVHVVPPGVDAGADEIVFERPAGPPTIITVARMVERYKGHDVMLRALAVVRAEIPDVRWVVIGDGSLRPAYERRAAELGLPVEFRGGVSDDERDAAMAQAHVFAMPSRLPAGPSAGEGFGIVFLEAGLHGLPVVAGGVGGALDAVEDGVTGLLVDPEDHLAVANALVSLLRDRRRAVEMGRAGAQRARSLTWPHVAGRVADVLAEITAVAR